MKDTIFFVILTIAGHVFVYLCASFVFLNFTAPFLVFESGLVRLVYLGIMMFWVGSFIKDKAKKPH